jgi:hypothetical protein
MYPPSALVKVRVPVYVIVGIPEDNLRLMPVDVPVVDPDIVIALVPLKIPVYPVQSILFTIIPVPLILQSLLLLNITSSVAEGTDAGLQLEAKFQAVVVPIQVFVAIIL